MTDSITLWTFVFTVLGVAIAAGGVFYAIKTLNAGAESLRLAAQEATKSTEIARAQFWIMVRGVLANYDDVHAKLRPGGIWAPTDANEYATRGPQDAAEWARLELYMGMFEYCEKLIRRDLLAKSDFSESYRYRLKNLVNNAVIVENKLHEFETEWQDFYSLCQRLGVSIPSREDLRKAKLSSLNTES